MDSAAALQTRSRTINPHLSAVICNPHLTLIFATAAGCPTSTMRRSRLLSLQQQLLLAKKVMILLPNNIKTDIRAHINTYVLAL
jgi:hypothetical protein